MEQSRRVLPAWLPWATTVTSILGVADSIYLTITHYTEKVTLACPDTGIINCQKVTQSVYSHILGVPLPLLGLAFFITALVVTSPMLWKVTTPWFVWARAAFVATGIPMVLWLIYVELYRLDAICLYCTGVHILTIVLFGLTAYGTEILLSKE